MKGRCELTELGPGQELLLVDAAPHQVPHNVHRAADAPIGCGVISITTAHQSFKPRFAKMSQSPLVGAFTMIVKSLRTFVRSSASHCRTQHGSPVLAPASHRPRKSHTRFMSHQPPSTACSTHQKKLNSLTLNLYAKVSIL